MNEPTLTRQQADAAIEQSPGERVTEDYMRSRIVHADYFRSGKTTTICAIELDNGFVVVGKSGAADPSNFDPEIGKRYAFDDAFKQLWPLFGFLLTEARFRRSA